jgi:hypothetical protein
MVGIVGAVVRVASGNTTWFRATAEGIVITVVVALVLPQLESLFWLARRKTVLLDEANQRIAALQAKAIAAAAEPTDATREGLRRSLGDLKLAYVQLERAFIAQNGAKELWHKQTKLHNAALAIIDQQLGRDYWAQFKDAKESPLVVPQNFPLQDHEALNLLYMIHGRSEWLSRTIDELRGMRNSDAAPRRPAAAPSRQESRRLTETRRILREAADYVRAMPSGRGAAEDALRIAWVVHQTVPEFLKRAFLVPPTQDYLTYINAEQDKQRDKFEMRATAAEFLTRLAGRITEDDLDNGFLMPNTWLQFRETDPPRNWPANVR